MVPNKKKVKEKLTESMVMVLDVYESWLAKQPVRSVKAKSGFNSKQEIETA